MLTNIPTARIRTGNDGEINSSGDYVLYWMIANRRTRWNYSLDRGDRVGSTLKNRWWCSKRCGAITSGRAIGFTPS